MKAFLRLLTFVLALPVALHAQMISSLTATGGPSGFSYQTSSDPYWAQFGVSGTSTGVSLVNVMSGASSSVTVSPITATVAPLTTAGTQYTSGIDFVYDNGTSPQLSTTNNAGDVSVATPNVIGGGVLSFTLTFNQAVSEGTLDLVANSYQSYSTYDFTFSNGATKSVDDPVPAYNSINGYSNHNDNDVYTLSFSDVPMGSVLTVTDTEVSGIYGGNTSISGVAFTLLDAPEPSTWAMLLAGLAFLGFRIRRRSVFRS